MIFDLCMLKLRMYLYLLIGYLLQLLQVVWTEILLKTGCNISLSINDVEVKTTIDCLTRYCLNISVLYRWLYNLWMFYHPWNFLNFINCLNLLCCIPLIINSHAKKDTKHSLLSKTISSLLILKNRMEHSG